jgi:Holliday junction resolvase RusA-like endonuclease
MKKILINIAPLSVNQAWAGRRFKSEKYKRFSNDVNLILPRVVPIKGFVEVHYTFYIKNFGNSDVDNLIKPIQDLIVQKEYIEDDRKIVSMSAKKIKVANYKDEKIEVEFYEYKEKKQ